MNIQVTSICIYIFIKWAVNQSYVTANNFREVKTVAVFINFVCVVLAASWSNVDIVFYKETQFAYNFNVE
jgi:hypothetical protein